MAVVVVALVRGLLMLHLPCAWPVRCYKQVQGMQAGLLPVHRCQAWSVGLQQRQTPQVCASEHHQARRGQAWPTGVGAMAQSSWQQWLPRQCQTWRPLCPERLLRAQRALQPAVEAAVG